MDGVLSEKIKLQLFLSRSGVCSRRRAFELIKEGCVKINGVVRREPSYWVNSSADEVFLNDKKIVLRRYEYVLLNKPRGVTTTKKDRFARRIVLDLIPKKLKHLNPVGRLDKDSSGLLLLTNDGELAYRLTHPRFKINKIYHLVLSRALTDRDRKNLQQGVQLDDAMSAPCSIEYLDNKKVEISLHEGRKRQIKRMFAGLGYKVINLERIKEGVLSLDNLPRGKWRHLSKDEVRRLISETKADEE